MPWEKTFDIDDVLEAAMNVFWAKGYDETSMSDLTSAMGINKGSLYNAFGSKKALFIAALKKYDEEKRRQILGKLSEMHDPAQAIATLFDGMIQQCIEGPEYKGCFLINTSLKLSHHDKEVQVIVKEGLRKTEQFFEDCLNRIKERDKTTSIEDSKHTAKILTTLVVGFRVLSRGVFDEASLRAIKKEALQLIR